ncbi:hydrolase [Clostridium thermosuccinogenes]|jgi:2-keto-3-deoxy-6-phosphogluconate aldolase|uniref:Hydrolase n=1 Tax=Clostridium thermosuccinogenes TaxID=84032 RepID=A0A2K2FI55_9CLOT|nr:hydrolase [Pseudoclostridium thermosuccinogenes]AUS95612.1 hydrolase [Pseudoclostridium thermosuccinogenes]PNT90473.1 hydrolase [Pseudoclostridium thermosuccinogenes]PNT98428.1 hydrolase [Pseudoclostridium thermosuccinogenes]PNU00496.1 hydrolase [Pseudoclostridium thermosuccinogenes]
MSKFIPEIDGNLRRHMVRVPDVINEASGIRIFGKLIKSLIFSTDVAIIKNCNAHAVIAVYPFTPQPLITHSIITASDIPVFCGVGGGTTTGKRVVNLAQDAEFQGAIGVVVNAPTPNDIVRKLRDKVDIPVVVTVVSDKTDFKARIESGATILNVSGAANTANIVKKIRDQFPEVPIIATGGPSEESILKTIEAGANAITYTPPTCAEIFKSLMNKYRIESDII